VAAKGHRVGYVRVSTVDQNVERQLDGIELDRVFTDKASGKDTQRPQLQAALGYLREGDELFVHSMDRLARNAEDLLRVVRQLTAFGEFERDLIRERQREGIAIAKAKGVYKGRTKALKPEAITNLCEMAQAGMSKAELARTYGISRETVYAYLRAAD